MIDANGTVLMPNQKVEINGQIWRVGSMIENGQQFIDTRDGMICINRIAGVYGGRNRWYVDPSRLTVAEIEGGN